MAMNVDTRNRFGIISDILSLCRTPTEKTRISRKCNVGLEQLTKYLFFLVSKNLLTSLSRGGEDLYQTTRKGKDFVEDYIRVCVSCDS